MHYGPAHEGAVNVYALFGVEPEIQAYAMARYSRSSGSMAESIRELTAAKAGDFLNTFYFEYGHRSIADMAHLTFALEDISILAAMRVVDEPLWDGQERSTRYQTFRASSYVVPTEIEADPEAHRVFSQACNALFDSYENLTSRLVEVLTQSHPRPDEMRAAGFRRILRARAFDIARGLLPLGTRTSVGQVVSARTLESQISRLLADPYAELREVGTALREACLRPAQNPALENLLDRTRDSGPLPEALQALLDRLEPPPLAPTLVKYTEPVPYPRTTLEEMARQAEALLPQEKPDRSRIVELAAQESPEDEAVATLLYRADPRGRSYGQVRRAAQGLSEQRKNQVLDLAVRDRGPHDELPRELRSGYALKFDILMDIGAFRDLHRHRRCIQIIQELTPDHGYDDPATIFRRGLGGDESLQRAKASGLLDQYSAALDRAGEAVRSLQRTFPRSALYALPLAYRTRALFKMDAAEAAFIVELRTGVAGHFSYRHVAWEMLQELKRVMPNFAAHLETRATDPNQSVDLLQR